MSARHLDWNDLAVFLAIARGGTLAAAGRALGVDASTVQRRVGRLESELATRLFDRSQRGYVLTPTGQELLRHTAAIEADVLAAQRAVSGRDQRLEGTVRVTTVDDLATSVLPPLLRSFRALHPGVTLSLSIHPGFVDLSRHQADVAIRFGRRPTDADVVVKHVARVQVALYGERAYLDARCRPTSLEALAEHDVVCGDEHMAAVPMEQLVARHAAPGRVAYRSNSMLARLVAIREGMGVGFLAGFMAAQEPALERLAVDAPDLSTDLWMLVHVDLRGNARVRAFVDHVYGGLVEQRDRFAS